MPPEGIDLMAHEDLLSFEEIVKFVTQAVKMGITKVRLTGGEPLVRKGIVDLVKMISNIPGIEDLSMTTNGILLDKFAIPLVKAGLSRVNISLDTMDPVRFSQITRGGDIQQVFKGIQAARSAGLAPIKINCVKMKESDPKDTLKLRQFCKDNELSLRFIHQMDLASGDFSVVEGGNGGNCAQCNRIRLTANGNVKPCLFNSSDYDVKKLGHKGAIEKAIKNKPREGTHNKSGRFYNIGG